MSEKDWGWNVLLFSVCKGQYFSWMKSLKVFGASKGNIDSSRNLLVMEMERKATKYVNYYKMKWMSQVYIFKPIFLLRDN